MDTTGLFQLEIFVSTLLPIYFAARNNGEQDAVIHQVKLSSGRVVVSKKLMKEIKRRTIEKGI